LHLQRLRNEASSKMGDVYERQRSSMTGSEGRVPAGGDLHG